jgi:hypothetical protein
MMTKSQAQDPTTMEANAQPTDDRGQEAPEGVQRQIQRTLQGRKQTDARSASPGSSTIKAAKHSRANRGKLRSTENKMDQQFVSHQVKLDDEEPLVGEIFCCQTMFQDLNSTELIALVASSDPDHVFSSDHEGTDTDKFIEAVQRNLVP